MKRIKDLLYDDTGAASIEYAIIAAVLVVALIAIMASIGSKVNNKMADVRDNVLNDY